MEPVQKVVVNASYNVEDNYDSISTKLFCYKVNQLSTGEL